MPEKEIACRQQPGLRHGCQVHTVSSVGGGGSGQKIFAICQHALDPGLMLHAHIADKLLIQELCNIIFKPCPQTPQSLFNMPMLRTAVR